MCITMCIATYIILPRTTHYYTVTDTVGRQTASLDETLELPDGVFRWPRDLLEPDLVLLLELDEGERRARIERREARCE